MSSRLLAWTWVAVFTAIIYLTLPVAPRLWRAVAVEWLGSWQEPVVLGGLVLAVGGSVMAGLCHRPVTPARHLGGLLAVGAGYASIVFLVELTPAEKLHFLYYGVLALLAFRALSFDLDGRWLAMGTIAAVSGIGLGDEVVQHFLPNRFFEWKDVALNAVSGALATGIIVLLRPEGVR